MMNNLLNSSLINRFTLYSSIKSQVSPVIWSCHIDWFGLMFPIIHVNNGFIIRNNYSFDLFILILIDKSNQLPVDQEMGGLVRVQFRFRLALNIWLFNICLIYLFNLRLNHSKLLLPWLTTLQNFNRLYLIFVSPQHFSRLYQPQQPINFEINHDGNQEFDEQQTVTAKEVRYDAQNADPNVQVHGHDE